MTDSVFGEDRLFLCSTKVNDSRPGSEVICVYAAIEVDPRPFRKDLDRECTIKHGTFVYVVILRALESWVSSFRAGFALPITRLSSQLRWLLSVRGEMMLSRLSLDTRDIPGSDSPSKPICGLLLLAFHSTPRD
jgi:hypothetical protein